MMEPSTERLNDLIRSCYSDLDEKHAIAIRINDLAERVYSHLDPLHVAPGLVEWAAVLEIRQLARGICRTRQAQGEIESESGSLFDFALQPRYPAERDDCEAYVLRGHLTLEERQMNISRLRHEAEAKRRHANALEAETEELIRQGVLFSESFT